LKEAPVFLYDYLNPQVEKVIELLVDTEFEGSSTVWDIFNLDQYGDATPDEEGPEQQRLFQEWLKSYAENQVYDAVSRLASGVQSDNKGRILVFREIMANPDWIQNINVRGLGEYWAWDKRAAEAHWGMEGSVRYLISAAVDPRLVHWERTLQVNADPSYEEEKEIYVPEGSPMEVLQLEADEKIVDPRLYAKSRLLRSSADIPSA